MTPYSIDTRRRVARAPVAFLCALVSSLFLHAVEFAELEPLFHEHCVECHGAKEPEGGLILESFDGLMKGGESGPALTAGKSAESLLVKALEGNWGKAGKNQFMPPGKREKLTTEQISLFKAWIDAGAVAPQTTAGSRVITTPKIVPKGSPRRSIQSLAFDPKSRLLAVARPEAVELVNVDTRSVVRSLTGFRGSANAVVISADGQFVFAGAGDATGGEIIQWRLADGSRVRSLGGHSDAVYSLALTPDGKTLASGGYDYSIRLWNLDDGMERVALSVNQGAIMGLAFRPDGQLLASAGYDRTAKIYAMPGGARLETFPQALKELNTVVFSPDGQTLLTGGGDNRIRAYQIGGDGREGSNALTATVFAHEGAILRLNFSPDGRTLASSADDRTVKLFDAATLKPRLTLEPQSDWPSALTFAGDGMLVVGRADGSLSFYDPTSGKPSAPPRPELSRTEPRGVQRGHTTRLRLVGRQLERAAVISLYREGRLWSAFSPETMEGGVGLTVEPPEDEPTGFWEISVGDGTIESGRIRLWVDDLVQREVAATKSNLNPGTVERVEGAASVWSTLETPGTATEFVVPARAGQTLVFDLWAQRLGAKGDFSLSLLDASGRTVAFNDSVAGQPDPLVIFQAPADGLYRVRVNEVTYAGSMDHFFRLSIGDLPYVTGLFPLSVPAGQEATVQLLGANLPAAGKVILPSSEPGEQRLPAPASSWRSRRPWSVLVSDAPAPAELEPNDEPGQANSVPVPVSVNGQFLAPSIREMGEGTNAVVHRSDRDYFRFPARRGVTYIVETAAAQRGSRADTRLAVLWPDGRPVGRLRLQAVRNSAITFRPETSDDTGIRFDNWEEMELNDLLWCGGEVMKIIRAPQGPDSDTALYASNGRRAGFFDTSPTAHYLDEPVYLVTALDQGEQPVPNGLPVFTVHYENDDSAKRDMGGDSRIHFTAPAEGEFLVQATDARGFTGPEYGYALKIREAQPGFAVTLNGANPTVAAGSGQGFNVTVKRWDGFEGSVAVQLNHLPAGWAVSGPLLIEAGHDTASSTLNAAMDATQPRDADWDAVKAVATAEVEGRLVAMAVNNLGRPKLTTDKPKIRVRLEPLADRSSTNAATGLPGVVIVPGGSTGVRLSIERNGFEGVVTFSVDNLPHGVIVENLGLNGITFLADENERVISLAAARWVGDTERPFYAVENQAGRQTSSPLLLRVRRPTLSAERGRPARE